MSGRTTGRRGAGGLVTMLFGLAIVLASAGLTAHEISFDRSTVRTDDFVTLTISLEGGFVGVDRVTLPLENLELVAGPSTSTEFRWVNGRTSRRRVLTYRLRPEEAGIGAVGPVVLTAPNGDELTLKRVTVEVIDPVRDRSGRRGDLSLSRLPAIVVEVSKQKAWAGEQIEVRWSLYGENIRGVQLLELPALDGFWVEQLDSDETTREVIRIGDELIQRQTLRHALLYPLDAGTHEIGPLAASVRVYRRDPFGDVNGWNPFGGNVTEVTRQSDAITIEVQSPPDPSVPVGSFDMTCSDPRVPAHGPVAIDLQLAGAANLRAVTPPDLSKDLDAGVEVEPLGTVVRERSGSISMQRGWRYLLFPDESGNLKVPPITFRFFDPEVREVRIARCGGWVVPVHQVQTIAEPETGGEEQRPIAEDRSLVERYWVPVTITAAGLALLIPLLMSRVRRDRGAVRLLSLVDRPVELRRELDTWLVRHGHHSSRLRTQQSEVGEAWRSVSSLIDLIEREPWEEERSRDELRRRLRDLIDEVAR